MVTVPKLTNFVPGPSQYNLVKDWNKVKPSHTQKMVNGPIMSFIDTIIKNNKSPEKSTPSPLAYKNDEAWLTSQKALRIIGSQKFNEERTTYFMEKVSLADETPGHIYKTTNPVSLSF